LCLKFFFLRTGLGLVVEVGNVNDVLVGGGTVSDLYTEFRSSGNSSASTSLAASIVNFFSNLSERARTSAVDSPEGSLDVVEDDDATAGDTVDEVVGTATIGLKESSGLGKGTAGI